MFRNMLTTLKFLSNSRLLLSPLLIIASLPLFVPTDRASALVESDLLTSYKTLDFTWNSALNSFEDANSAYPNLTFFENNHYVFNNNSAENLFLTNAFGSSYTGSEIFENNTSGPNRYLIFSPESNNTTPRSFFYYNPENSSNFGSIQVLPYVSTGLIQDNTTSQGAKFSYSLEVDSINQLVLAGAPGENSFVGKVVVYDRSNDLNLSELVEISPPAEFQESNMQFGSAISAFDDLLAIAAPNNDSFSGAIYTYKRQVDKSYQFIEKIVDDNGYSGDIFGYKIQLSDSWLVASSPQTTSNGNGKISIYNVESNNSVSFHSYLNAADASVNDEFGYDISLDGNLLVVGAPGVNSATNGDDSGAAYVFEWNASGNQWEEKQKLSPESLSVDDQFGYSVSISNNFIFVGCLKGDGNGVDSGSLHVFKNNGTEWIEIAGLAPPTSLSGQLFSADIDSRGNSVFISSPGSGTHGQVFAFGIDQNHSDWKLISTIDYNQSSVLAGSTTMAPIATGDGMIVIGSPEEGTPSEACGGFQVFFNPAWTGNLAFPSTPPLFTPNLQSSFSLNEDGATFTFDFNASHKFDQNFTWSITSDLGNIGNANISSDSGLLSFSTLPNLFGDQNLTIQVATENSFATHEIVISVIAVNDPPEFLYDSNSVYSLPAGMLNELMNFNLNLQDVDGDDLDISLKGGTNMPAGLILEPSGLASSGHKITGRPTSLLNPVNNVAEYTFTLICSDPDGAETEQDFSILIYKENSPPQFDYNGSTPSTVSLELLEDFSSSDWDEAIQSLSFSDSDGDGFTLSINDYPVDGNLTVINSVPNSDSKILYIPEPDANGERSFTITITDDNIFPKKSEITFNITIESVDDSPRILSTSPPSEANEAVFYSHQFELYDPDENDSITFQLRGLPSWLTSTDDNLSISGTPSWADYNDGVPSVIFLSLRDQQGNTIERSYSIQVIPNNYPPVISQSTTHFVISEDQTPNPWPFLQLNAIDPDKNDTNSTLIWSIAQEPDAQTGTVIVESNNSTALVHFQPEGNYSGMSYFSVKVSEHPDSNASDTINITVEIEPVEDTPIFESSAQSLDAIQGYSWQYEIFAVDGDSEQSLVISSDTTLPPWLTLINISKGSSILYGTPVIGQTGSYPIILRVEDGNGNFNLQEFTLDVLAENTAPTLSVPELNNIQILEDQSWITNQVSVIDPDRQNIFWLLDQHPIAGKVEFNPNFGKQIEFSYTPDGNFSGSDAFTIRVTDGITSAVASYSVSIEEVPDPPLFSVLPEFLDISDDVNLSKTIVVKDGDGLEELSLSFSGKPDWIQIDDQLLDQNGTIFISGSPTSNDHGTVNLSLSIMDATDPAEYELTHSINFVVAVYNQPPQFELSKYSFETMEDIGSITWADTNITVTDDQTSQANLIWSIGSQPEFGSITIEQNGTNLTYFTENNRSGLYSFTLIVTDDGGINSSLPKSTSVTIDLNVTNTPDAPVFISNPQSDRVDKVSWNDESEYNYIIETFDADLTFPVIELISPIPNWLKFENLHGTEPGISKAELKGTPKVGDEGTYKIEIRTTDGYFSATQLFNLEIRIDDYPPQFLSTKNDLEIKKVRIFIDEDSNVTDQYNLPIHYYAKDPDPKMTGGISWAVSQYPKTGNQLIIDGNGTRPESFQYFPAKNFNGYDEFYLKASDGHRESELKFEVFVRPLPDAPTFLKPESTKFSLSVGDYFEVLLEAVDEDSSNLEFKKFTPSWEDNEWLFLKDGNSSKSVYLYGNARINKKSNTIPVSVSVTDESGRFDTLDLIFSLDGTNQSPVIQTGRELSIIFSADGEPISLNLNDLIATDPEGDLISWEPFTEDGKQMTLAEQSFSFRKYTSEDANITLEQNGSKLSKLEYFPNVPISLTGEFILRASDGISHDQITIYASVLKDTMTPVIEGNNTAYIEQGEYFALDFKVLHQEDNYDVFLTKGPDWVSLYKLSNSKFRISGTSPLQDLNLNTIEFYATSGGRKSSNFNLSIQTIDSTPPKINLLGERVISMSKGSAFSEPGYFAEDKYGNVLTNQVIVTPDLDQNITYNVLNYTVEDQDGSSTTTSRYVNIYDSFPLNFSNALYFKTPNRPVISWTPYGNLILCSDGLTQFKSIDSDKNISTNIYDIARPFISRIPSEENEIEILHQLLGDNVQIKNIKKLDHSYYLTGLYQDILSISGKTNISQRNYSFFVCKLNETLNLDWIKSFNSDEKVSNLQIVKHSNEGVILGGDFIGNLYEDENLLLSSTKQSSDIFLLTISDLNSPVQGSNFGQDGNETLSSMSTMENGDLVLAINVQKTAQNPYGVLMALDQEFNPYPSAISFESDYANYLNDLLVLNESIYVACKFSEELFFRTSDNQNVASSDRNASTLLKFSASLKHQWTTLLEAEEIASLTDIESTTSGDLIGLVEHTGKISGLNNQDLKGKKDISIFRFNHQDGSILWNENIGGEEDEIEGKLVINESGTMRVLFKSESDFVSDGIEINATLADEYLMLSFKAGSSFQFLEEEKLILTEGDFFTSEIKLLNANYAQYHLIEAPNWVSLIDHGQGSATISGIPSKGTSNGVILISAHGFDRSSANYSLEFSVLENNASFSNLEIPERTQNYEIQGNGRILSLEDYSNNQIGVLGNTSSNLSYQGVPIIPSGRKAGFFLLLDDDFNYKKNVLFDSTVEGVVKEMTIDEEGNTYIVGHFKNNLSIDKTIYSSNGGYDIFLTKLSPTGDVLSVNTYGGYGDDISSKLVIDEDKLILSGQFSESFPVNGKLIESIGSQDGFIAIFKTEQLNTFFNFHQIGGAGYDEITDFTTTESGSIFLIGNFRNSIIWKQNTYHSKFSQTNSFIASIDENSEEDLFELLFNNGTMEAQFLKYNPLINRFYIAGEFDKSISLNGNYHPSKGGLDLFVMSLNKNLYTSNVKTFGGSGTDRVSAFELNNDGNLFLSGTFAHSIELGNDTINSMGDTDSYIASLNPDTLEIQDTLLLQGLYKDQIDAIRIIRSNYLLYGSTIESSLNEVSLHISLLGDTENKPILLTPFPEKISSNNFLNFEFETGPWLAEQNNFTISSDLLPSWMHLEVNTDGSGVLSGQPPFKSQDLTYNFGFSIKAESGEALDVSESLIVKDSSQFSPIIKLEKEYSFYQFEDFKFTMHVYDRNNDPLLINPTIPSWMSFSASDSGPWEFTGSAGVGETGSHIIEVMAVDTSGLESFVKAKINIKPNLGGNSSSNEELPTGWDEQWIGTYAISNNGWCYHTVWKWVWLQPSNGMNDLWFLTEAGNWYWTNSDNWDAQNQSGYLYSATKKSWTYCMQNLGDQTIFYDYTEKVWTKFE